MTEESAASTSSAETEPSTPWPDVARLGESIVNELGLGESIDTLGRWMAHRVAELIQRAEGGDENAAGDAARLTLDVWRRRSDWPSGWPPPRSAQVIERLVQSAEPVDSPFGPGEREPEAGEDPWLARLGQIGRLLDSELEVWRRLVQRF